MTKKSIADLLKEEVEKPSEDSAAEAKPAKAAASKTGDRKRSSASSSTASSAASSAKSTPKAAAAKSPAVKAAASAESAAHKKATELETSLKKASDQISALQEDVKTHQERIFELKDSLQTAESESKNKDIQIKMLTSELNEAKQNILKLTEASEKASKVAAEKASPPAADKAAKPADRQSLSLQNSPRRSYKSIPEYAIQRGTPLAGQNNSMMSDDDIGWVD